MPRQFSKSGNGINFHDGDFLRLFVVRCWKIFEAGNVSWMPLGNMSFVFYPVYYSDWRVSLYDFLQELFYFYFHLFPSFFQHDL